ncbi:CHK1 checkpoint protein [Echinococcus multilocularis]|uniref:CHK1 checkpoint protein n=1 Tax=Echinococcus multilocularis TaxID=6211 RepID=A0A0S4MK56_ECHMU|nr:CHK1 checkpoint protein [Echinococcus multilocularis]CUT99112.1 CHK1 checkpoint protein [Echinococcus multilocularis]
MGIRAFGCSLARSLEHYHVGVFGGGSVGQPIAVAAAVAGGGGGGGVRSTGLILPVDICLSQRSGPACLRSGLNTCARLAALLQFVLPVGGGGGGVMDAAVVVARDRSIPGRQRSTHAYACVQGIRRLDRGGGSASAVADAGDRVRLYAPSCVVQSGCGVKWVAAAYAAALRCFMQLLLPLRLLVLTTQ